MQLRRDTAYPCSQEELKALETCHVFKADKVIWRNVDARAVILNLKSATYYSIDGAGLRIWELIGKGIAVSDVIKTICCEYNQKERVVQRDLADILTTMKKEGIIELKPGGNK